jgi:hypothetical protein
MAMGRERGKVFKEMERLRKVSHVVWLAFVLFCVGNKRALRC